MAAHVVDEEVETELDDGIETANVKNENGVAYEVKALLPLLPPALIPHSNYSQVTSSS